MQETLQELTEYLAQVGWLELVIVAVIGIAVAFFGYRIRLVFFFVLGFAVVAAVAAQLFAQLGGDPEVAWIPALIGGVIAGFVAARLYRVAIFLAGMVLGTFVIASAAVSFTGEIDTVVLVAAGIGAIAGGLAALVVDRVAVILASALIGGVHAAGALVTLLERGIHLSDLAQYTVFIVLGVLFLIGGIYFQFSRYPWRPYGPRRREAEGRG